MPAILISFLVTVAYTIPVTLGAGMKRTVSEPHLLVTLHCTGCG